MNSIQCECGEHISLSNELKEIESDALFDGDSSNYTVEVTCKNCGSVYDVKLSAHVEVTSKVDSVELKTLGLAVDDEGNKIRLNDCAIGEKVDISDGIYQIGQKEFHVENGHLMEIFNAVITDDQLIFFSGEV